MTHIIELPWPTPPLTMNQRGASHGAVYAKARTKKEIRDAVKILAKAAHIPHDVGHAIVELHYRPCDNRRRDTDNLVETAKPIYDGLVDFGLVPDDIPQFMAKPEPVIHRGARTISGPRLWLEITTTDLAKELPA